jgi:hypothetical protein
MDFPFRKGADHCGERSNIAFQYIIKCIEYYASPFPHYTRSNSPEYAKACEFVFVYYRSLIRNKVVKTHEIVVYATFTEIYTLYLTYDRTTILKYLHAAPGTRRTRRGR